MTQEEKDKLLKKLNQMLEKSDEAISIWVLLIILLLIISISEDLFLKVQPSMQQTLIFTK